MMRPIILAMAAALAGCANLDVIPYTVEVKDPAAFTRDLGLCRDDAVKAPHHLSITAISNATAQGGLGNAAGAAINPLVPLAGAVGSGGSELLREIGLLTTAQRAVLVDCLRRKGDKSGQYFVLEPTS